MRRVHVKLDPDAVEDPAPENWREWLGGVLGSPRVAGRVGTGTRLLHRANLALLVIGLIGFQSLALHQVADDRVVALSDLEVNFTRLDGLERRVKELSKPDNPSVPQSLPAQKFEEVVRHVERFEAQANAAKPTPPEPPKPPEDLERARAELEARKAELKRQEAVIEEVRAATARPERRPDGKEPPPHNPGDHPPPRGSTDLDGLKAQLAKETEGPTDRAGAPRPDRQAARGPRGREPAGRTGLEIRPALGPGDRASPGT